jgi:two-component system response regulator YesN
MMKSMDGIEMFKIIKDELPYIKLIFISCFDDFKFASQAIEEGANGYVLKPVLPTELLAAIEKVISLIKTERKNRELLLQKEKVEKSISVLRENFYRSLLFGLFNSEEDVESQAAFLNISLAGKKFCCVCAEVGQPESDKAFYRSVYLLDRLKQFYADEPDVFCLLSDLSHIVVLFSIESGNGAGLKKKFIRAAEKMIGHAVNECGITVSAGIGTVAGSAGEINASFKSALKALEHKYYAAPDEMSVIDAEEVEPGFANCDIPLETINERVKTLLFSDEDRDAGVFARELLRPLHDWNMSKAVCLTVVNAVQMQLLQMNGSLEKAAGPYADIAAEVFSLPNIRAMEGWMAAFLSRVSAYLNESNKAAYADVVQKMDDYIAANYFKGIVLQDVAENVYLSPNYANYIFKNIRKKTVHQCIEEKRMEASVRLLTEDMNKKVLTVGEELGYGNSSYFINVFKKFYGCTPSDYRKRMASKTGEGV